MGNVTLPSIVALLSPEWLGPPEGLSRPHDRHPHHSVA